MNKAFTRETDESDEDDAPESAPPLPAGTRNYMTPGGFARLKGELDRLVGSERPELVATIAWAASNGDRSENGDYIYGKKRLREVDRRIRFLVRRLDRAEVVDPRLRAEGDDDDRVFFGATVDVVNAQRRAAHREHRRRRRDRHRARLHQLGVADGARAHQGARRRHGDACTRRAAARSSRSSRYAMFRLRTGDAAVGADERSAAAELTRAARAANIDSRWNPTSPCSSRSSRR